MTILFWAKFNAFKQDSSIFHFGNGNSGADSIMFKNKGLKRSIETTYKTETNQDNTI